MLLKPPSNRRCKASSKVSTAQNCTFLLQCKIKLIKNHKTAIHNRVVTNYATNNNLQK